MKQIITLITTLVLMTILAATIGFSLLQIQKSRLVDESLVSSLTTKLDTNLIDQAIQKINPTTGIDWQPSANLINLN